MQQQSEEAKKAKAMQRNARISLKHAIVLCKFIRNKKLDRAKKFLENLVTEKVSLKRKHYTKAAKQILKILESAEANAKSKNLTPEGLFVESAKASKGEKFIRPKSRAKFSGRKAKSTNIEIVLSVR